MRASILRPDLVPIVEGEHEIGPVRTLERAMGAGSLFTVHPIRSKAASARLTFAAPHVLTRLGR